MADVILSQTRARELAEAWVADWNARDLEAILSHYAEDVVFDAPTVVTRHGEPSGVLRGKAALREHFRKGLEVAGANLRFTLLDVLAGVHGYTAYYSRETGATVVDLVILNTSEKAVEVHAHFHAAQQGLAADAPQAARR